MKALIFTILVFLSLNTFGQIPTGYYDDAIGLNGDALRTVLFDIIKGHNSQSYSSLWTHFQTTDDKANGDVWDMYSDNPGGVPAYTFTFVTNQCGNYAQEGDCYNREHSFPKSWFNDASPMNTDIFHLYPTDGYVNGRRSYYSFGEVGTATWTSTNGCNVGPCTYPGYSGTVFEPIDEYKGDFARTYFYMMTRYKTSISNWNSPMLQADNLSDWAKNMLKSWHSFDTVSQKEIDRNEAVYGIQNNRNPFIDHPEWVYEIWGNNADIKVINPNEIKMWFSDDKISLERKISGRAKLNVYESTGKLIKSFSVDQQSESISFNAEKGLYIIVFTSNKEFSVLKIVK